MPGSNERHARIPAWVAGFTRDGRGLSARQLNVLIALAAHADREGRAFPSVQRLSELTRMSRRSVFQQLKTLKEVGLIELERAGGGRGRSNIYRLFPSASATNVMAEPPQARLRPLTKSEAEQLERDARSRGQDYVSARALREDAESAAATRTV